MADNKIAIFVFLSKADGMSSGCLFQIQCMADCTTINAVYSGHTGQITKFIYNRRIHHDHNAAVFFMKDICHLHAQHGRMIKSTLCSLGVLDQTIINLVDTTFHGIASTASSNDGIHSGQVNISIFQKFINYFHAIVQLVIDGRKSLQYR